MTDQRLLAQLVGVEVLDQRGRVLDEARVLAEDLERPFGMKMENGVASSFVHDAAATENAFGLTSQILAALQLSAGKLSSKEAATEWDATGLARISYEPRGGGKFGWTKKDYERVVALQSGSHSNARRTVAPTIESSSGEVVVDDQGIRLIERKEAISVQVAESSAIDTKITLRLERTSDAVTGSLPEWSAFATGARTTAAGEGFGWTGTARVDDLKRGNFTLATALEALRKSAKEGSSVPSDEVHQAQRALVALLRENPESLRPVLEALQTASPAEENLLLDALGTASTPGSLNVLAGSAVSPKLTIAQRGKAASAMIRAQWPTVEALEALERLVKEPKLREHGLMGIGTFVRRFREARAREPMERGIEDLRRELTSPNGKAELVPVLLGIANSGAPEFYELVVPLQDSPKKDVRDAAIQAIRLMNDPRVEPRLTELLARTAAEDKRSALHALRPRQPESTALVEGVRTVASEYPDPDVRREAVLVLKSWSNTRPELSAALASLRSKEQDQRVLRALN